MRHCGGERVIDPALEQVCTQAQRSIKDHLVDFQAKMQAGAKSADHVARTIRVIGAICSQMGFKTAQDISADGVNQYAESLREAGRSARTIQSHLTAIKSFTNWLSRNHKLLRDPLTSVTKPNPKSDRRRERRMLLPDEWSLLLSATKGGPEGNGMSGPERALMYRVAVETGLRSNELRSLVRGQLYVDEEQPFITCKAGSTKNSKLAKQYIRHDLAEELRQYVMRKAPKAKVFQPEDRTRMAATLRDDLASARKKWLLVALLFIDPVLANRNHSTSPLKWFYCCAPTHFPESAPEHSH